MAPQKQRQITTPAQRVPPSSFAEPSDPAHTMPTAPRGEQEENPQLVAHARGRQAADSRAAAEGEEGEEGSKRGKGKEELVGAGVGVGPDTKESRSSRGKAKL